MQRIVRTSASGPKMKFSQRLCEAKFRSAPIALRAAKNQVPQRKSGASLAAPQKPAQPSVSM
jgi:hypothetical protein